MIQTDPLDSPDIDVDQFARVGPKSGVVLHDNDVQQLLSHLGQVRSVQASASGYNNRLYLVTVDPWPTAEQPCVMPVKVVVKAGGRCWKRVKTEAEVAGLAVAASAAGASNDFKQLALPVPRVLAWRSQGPQELLALDHQSGVNLKTLWPHLHPTHRLSAITQLAHIVARIKTSPAAHALVSRGVIGNLSVHDGPVAHASGPPALETLSLGPMVDGGLGPWTPSQVPVVLQYIRDTTLAAAHILRSPALDVLSGMRTRLAPRIAAYLGALDAIVDGTAVASATGKLPADLTAWSQVPLDLAHTDLNLHNVLVTLDGISLPMSTDDPFALNTTSRVLTSLAALDPHTHPLTVTSVLDWEWTGVFPWTDDFGSSFDFVSAGDDAAAAQRTDVFYTVLESQGLPTPRTHAAATWVSGACAVRDALAPWWMRDLVDPTHPQHQLSAKEAEAELADELAKLGF